jgi:hypothetical protein
MSSSSQSEDSVWTLKVSRAELAKALRTVGRAGRALRDAQAVLTFEDRHLTIDLAGNMTWLPAEGDWPGEVRLTGGAVERLARVLPKEDPLMLRVEGDRFSAARFSVPCERRASSRPTPVRELVPPNADLFEILMIRSRCSDAEIDAAGAAGLMEQAERRLDDLCDRAATILAPYGVGAEHLRQLCEKHAEEGIRDFRESERKVVGQVARAWELLAPLGVEPGELKGLMENCLKKSWRSPK